MAIPQEMLKKIPWQIGIPLPFHPELRVTDENSFEARIGVGLFQAIVVDETQSGSPEAWPVVNPDGKRVWVAALPSEMD